MAQGTVSTALRTSTVSARRRYENQIRSAGGIDIQILGVGRNGHLAFNEPGSSLGSRTRVKPLSDETRRDNARFFASPDEVPTLTRTYLG